MALAGIVAGCSVLNQATNAKNLCLLVTSVILMILLIPSHLDFSLLI